MKIVCLSMWQPWAYLYCVGRKRIETRGWSALRRGIEHNDVILIHATKKRDAEILGACSDFGVHVKNLYFGGLIGGVIFDREIGPFDDSNTQEVSDEEMRYGNYEFGRYGFVASTAMLTGTPFPCPGSRLGFFPVPMGATEWLRSTTLCDLVQAI